MTAAIPEVGKRAGYFSLATTVRSMTYGHADILKWSLASESDHTRLEYSMGSTLTRIDAILQVGTAEGKHHRVGISTVVLYSSRSHRVLL